MVALKRKRCEYTGLSLVTLDALREALQGPRQPPLMRLIFRARIPIRATPDRPVQGKEFQRVVASASFYLFFFLFVNAEHFRAFRRNRKKKIPSQDQHPAMSYVNSTFLNF